MEGDVGEDHQVLDEGEQGVDWRDRADRSVYLSDEESQLSHRLRSAALHQSVSHGTSCCHISLDGDVYTVLRLRLLSVRSLGQAGQRIHKQQTTEPTKHLLACSSLSRDQSPSPWLPSAALLVGKLEPAERLDLQIVLGLVHDLPLVGDVQNTSSRRHH